MCGNTPTPPATLIKLMIKASKLQHGTVPEFEIPFYPGQESQP